MGYAEGERRPRERLVLSAVRPALPVRLCIVLGSGGVSPERASISAEEAEVNGCIYVEDFLLFEQTGGKSAATLLSAVSVAGHGWLKKRRPSVHRHVVEGLVAVYLLAATVFVGIDAWRDAQRRVTAGNVEQKITGWLRSFGLEPKKLPNSKEPKAFFGLQVEGRSKLNITVWRSHDLPHYILVEAKLRLSDEHVAMAEKLSRPQQDQFAREIQIELGRSGMDYYVGRRMREVSLTRRIPITDDLTEDAFLQRFSEVEVADMVVANAIGLSLSRLSQERSS